jgi:hypothetical protein
VGLMRHSVWLELVLSRYQEAAMKKKHGTIKSNIMNNPKKK